jgi:hypothetical protein
MYSTINMHLAGTRLQDSLRDAETARAAGAVPRPPHGRPRVALATAWQRKRRAPSRSRLSSGAMTHR